ncbi:tetratricopeptide repeat-containing protein [Nitrosopumilus cobalaminigenes]|uniref:Tetratricopeptide repeat-containing protein n=1 Tax=Nitrosopumilus cobalaminigenes TaxID=1470066 RepID=A0A7D5LZZ0_9ARCH|nr:tetratricopeptide repeat protein [Nitrosopumilus cobalaminigenes]QLH02395.1 tetratricopeptide repeat-containing protein [Nitrosopumilus cobalaminigenes]
MLGIVLGITLVLAVFSSVIFTEVYADSFGVHFDQDLYELGDNLTINGEISDVRMPVIAMSIYDPDGQILSANNLEISSDNTFSKTVSLDSPFYEKTGEYMVKLDYGQISENHYFLVDAELFAPDILIEEVAEPEIILLYTEQKQYTDKETVEITGLVSSKDSPTVLIGIYDPFGMPAGFYFGTIDSNLEFTTSFLVKDGVNFRVDGTYSVKAHYGESEATSFFDYSKVIPIDVDDSSENQSDENETVDEIDESNDDELNDENQNDSTEQSSDDSQDNSVIESKSVESKPIESAKETKSEIVTTENIEKKTSITKIDDLETKTTQKEIPTPKKITKENNLTVEDVELGKLLNQIKLDCDSSTYTDTISYYDGMGPALYRLCQFDSSLNFFNESLIDYPNDVEILVNKGSTLGKLGYYSEAILYYDHAIKIDPGFLPAKNNKANALANLGNFNDAVFLYNEVLEQNPNYLTARENLEIVLSSNFDISRNASEMIVENNYNPNISSTENISSSNSEKLKQTNFFDEVGMAFSTLGSLFGFLN